MSKLLVVALVALSVSKLEAELAANSYTADELREAIEAEKAGENRKTAIEALQDALDEPEPKPARDGLFVCKGKSITTKAGIKVAGDEIKAGMLPADSVEKLIKKGYIA